MYKKDNKKRRISEKDNIKIFSLYIEFIFLILNIYEFFT